MNVNIDLLYKEEALNKLPKDYLLATYMEVVKLLEKTRSYEKIVKYSKYKEQLEKSYS